MREPVNIFLIGPMGSGKSTIGRLLAHELGSSFVDSDHEIEHRCGCNIPWIFDVEGESGFRAREARVIEELTQYEGIVLATGGGAIKYAANRQHLRERGIVVFLNTSVAQQLRRTAKDRNRPLLQCANPEQKLSDLMNEREPLYRKTAHIIINTEKRSPRGVIAEIKRNLKNYRQKHVTPK